MTESKNREYSKITYGFIYQIILAQEDNLKGIPESEFCKDQVTPA